MSTHATIVTPLRSRDLDPDLLQRAADMYPGEGVAIHLHLVIVEHYIDAENYPQARIAMANAAAQFDSATDAVRAAFPVKLIHCFAIHQASVNRDAAATRLWWERAEEKKPTEFDSNYYIALTSLLWLESRFEEADAAWQKAAAEVAKLPPFGAYETDRLFCAFLRQELDSASGPHQNLSTPQSCANLLEPSWTHA